MNFAPASSAVKLYSWRQLSELVPYCRMHISRLEREGKFPQRLQLGAGRVAWLASEVHEWIASRPRGVLTRSET
jgi:prophage regulatory protein